MIGEEHEEANANAVCTDRRDFGCRDRAILISIAVETARLVLACDIGVGVWIAYGFIAAVVAGIITFALGWMIVVLIIETTLMVDLDGSNGGSGKAFHEVTCNSCEDC